MDIEFQNTTFTGWTLIKGGSVSFDNCYFNNLDQTTNLGSNSSNLNKDKVFSDFEAYSLNKKIGDGYAVCYFDPITICKSSSSYTLNSVKFNSCKVNTSTKTEGDIIFGLRWIDMTQTLNLESDKFTLSDTTNFDFSGLSWGTEVGTITEAKQLTNLTYFAE